MTIPAPHHSKYIGRCMIGTVHVAAPSMIYRITPHKYSKKYVGKSLELRGKNLKHANIPIMISIYEIVSFIGCIE